MTKKIKESATDSNGSTSTLTSTPRTGTCNEDGTGIDIKIPMSLLMTGTSAGSNECTVLVQVSPEDAPTLDFHGAGGAVGRFEVSDDTGMCTVFKDIIRLRGTWYVYCTNNHFFLISSSYHEFERISVSGWPSSRTNMHNRVDASNDWAEYDQG